MFNLQGSELIIILLLALVVLGPEKLPDAMRKAGQFYAEIKKMSSGFQSEFKAAVDEPLNELKNTANTLRDSADFTKLQSGERTEKPKSADMVAAPDPDAVPADDLPFAPDAPTAAAAAAALTESDLAPDALGNGILESDLGSEVAENTLNESDIVAAPPPKPFSSSQQLSTSIPQQHDAVPHVDSGTVHDDSSAPSDPEPGAPAAKAPGAAAGFSIPEASSWAQHFSNPESAEPPTADPESAEPPTADPDRPEPDSSQGDDPGTSLDRPAAGDIDGESGERSE